MLYIVRHQAYMACANAHTRHDNPVLVKPPTNRQDELVI